MHVPQADPIDPALHPSEHDRAIAVLDRHGSDLHLLATLLTHDPQTAEDIVVQAIIAHLGGPASRQELAEAVYLAWLCHAPTPVRGTTPFSTWGTSASIVEDMCALPLHERTALGLCRFGGHTYREAAALLSLPPEVVAQHLAAALRGLSRPLTPIARAVA